MRPVQGDEDDNDGGINGLYTSEKISEPCSTDDTLSKMKPTMSGTRDPLMSSPKMSQKELDWGFWAIDAWSIPTSQITTQI